MIGLPTETNEDLDDLVALVGKVVAAGAAGRIPDPRFHLALRAQGPHAFPVGGADLRATEIERRNNYLARPLRRLKVKVSLREPETSFLEGFLGLGDGDWPPVVRTGLGAGRPFRRLDRALRLRRVGAGPGRRRASIRDAYLADGIPRRPCPGTRWTRGWTSRSCSRDWRRAAAGADPAGLPPGRRLLRLHVLRRGHPAHLRQAGGAAGPSPAVVRPSRPRAGKAPRERSRRRRPLPAAGPAPGAGFDPRNADPDNPVRKSANGRSGGSRRPRNAGTGSNSSKTGDMVFLGHLDFQRQLHLALRRSGLPAAYSKGYHPHPLLKFGPPLPVGVVGLARMSGHCPGVPGARLDRRAEPDPARRD